ncbi:artemin [Amia ocellicauda]|uniref:artemin n=1 Tax=Amia ocellicauda TaxID=2972642 RepID=UPI0034647A5D
MDGWMEHCHSLLSSISSADRKRHWRAWGEQEVAVLRPGRRVHLRNWKVMLWFLGSLVALAEGGVPGEGLGSEPNPAVEGGPGSVGWTPPDSLELDETSEDIDVPSSWAGLFVNPPLLEDAEDHQGRWERSPLDSVQAKGKERKRPKDVKRDCRLRTKTLRVRDLGLGYESDEIVRFKYCAGSCQSKRTEYDLTLNALMKNGLIKSKEKVSSHPCCRPTGYEAVTFMDIKNDWQSVKNVSAKECNCVG